MDYVFVGQNIMGGAALQALLRESMPRLLITRNNMEYWNSVVQVGLQRGLPMLTSEKITKDRRILESLVALKPAVIICCGWGDIINRTLLDLPSLGWINLHPSMLPKYRGPSPIEWQIINGDRYAGCTAHFMSTRVDAGNIITQGQMEINEKDDSASLRNKCGTLLGELAVTAMSILDGNPIYKGEQQDEKFATYAPHRDHHRLIDWTCNSGRINNIVRGLSPYPCAQLQLDNNRFDVARIQITNIDSSNYFPGTIVRSHTGKFLIASADLFVEVVALRINNNIVEDYVSLLNNWAPRQ